MISLSILPSARDRQHGIAGLEISIGHDRPVRPLPEGDRYLGFMFARGETPAQVERTLRTAHGQLEIVIGEPSE